MKKEKEFKDPIFRTVVLMKDQEDCNRVKEICDKHSLPVFKESNAFEFVEPTYEDCYLYFYRKDVGDGIDGDYFLVDVHTPNESGVDEDLIVSIEAFEEMGENFNPQYNSVDDILSKMKELTRTLH